MLIRGSQIISNSVVDLQISTTAAIQTVKLADGPNFFWRNGSVPATGAFNMNSNLINNLGSPVSPGDAVNLSYLNTLNLGMTLKSPVRVATLTSLGTSYASNVLTISATTVIDGITLATGDRILVRNETTSAWNGIYNYTNSSTLTRSTDMNTGGTSGNIQMGDFIIVNDGSTYRGQAFILTEPFNFTPPIVVGTTTLSFTAYGTPGQFSAGNGIAITSNVITAVAASGLGLQVTTSGIGVLLADNTLQLAAGGLSAKTFAGLLSTGQGIQFYPGNGLTMSVVANAPVSVNPAANGGISVAAGGVSVALQTNPGLVLGATGLAIQLNGATLALGAAGLSLAALASANILVGNASSVATAVTISGDATLSNAGILTLTTTAAGGAVRASSFSAGETPGGTVNSANVAFTAAFLPIANTECVYINGIRQKRVTDYTLSSSTISFVAAPFTGDLVTIDYIH